VAAVKRTLTTSEAATALGIPPGSFARWARARGVEPLRRMRIGRSTVTVWSIAALATATRPTSTILDTERAAC
jgi:hypothetical protein